MNLQKWLPILLLVGLTLIDIFTFTPDDAAPGVGWTDEILLILITVLSYIRTSRRKEE